MLLIDSIYINNSGGKVLLDYLCANLYSRDNVLFFFDSRTQKNHLFKKDNLIFTKASLFSRHLLYQKHESSLSLIFSFSNLPPLKKYDVLTYTYFHQLKFIYNKYDAPLKEKVRTLIQRIVFKYLSKNTDFFIVQSSYMAKELSRKLNFDLNKILVIPFYSPLNISNKVYATLKDKNTFLYVSGGALHKNHFRLIEAFASFYDKNKIGTLFITISNPSKKLDILLQYLNKNNIPVVNLGEMPREELVEFYQKSEYIVYPSLAESFGLGLIEGLEFDCKVIGADLPYTYEVCQPSLVFNPFDVADIENAFHVASTTKLPLSIKKIENKIDELFQLFNLDTTPPR